MHPVRREIMGSEACLVRSWLVRSGASFSRSVQLQSSAFEATLAGLSMQASFLRRPNWSVTGFHLNLKGRAGTLADVLFPPTHPIHPFPITAAAQSPFRHRLQGGSRTGGRTLQRAKEGPVMERKETEEGGGDNSLCFGGDRAVETYSKVI